MHDIQQWGDVLEDMITDVELNDDLNLTTT